MESMYFILFSLLETSDPELKVWGGYLIGFINSLNVDFSANAIAALPEDLKGGF